MIKAGKKFCLQLLYQSITTILKKVYSFFMLLTNKNVLLLTDKQEHLTKQGLFMADRKVTGKFKDIICVTLLKLSLSFLLCINIQSKTFGFYLLIVIIKLLSYPRRLIYC